MSKKIYLCGPINSCSDKECKDWRDMITSMGFSTIDPIRRDYRGIELDNIDEIVEFDKIDIINSDIVLVNYIKPSIGTSMEILYGFERGRLIILVNSLNLNISPWLKYHCHKIFESFADALEFIGKQC